MKTKPIPYTCPEEKQSSMVGHGELSEGLLLPDNEPFRSLLIDSGFKVSEIKQTGSYLNPLNYFLRELERLAECNVSHKYITQDENYLYFNFNGVWNLISQSYKYKYLPFITSSNIKNLLKKSRYIARNGRDFEANENNPVGKPVHILPKLIKGITRRCYVLVKYEMPGFYQ